MPTDSPPPTIAPLWDRLRATFARVIAAVGAPAAIALLNLSSRHVRLGIVRQLLALENLARKLLIVEAAAFGLPDDTRGPQLVTVPIGLVTINPPPRARFQAPPRLPDLAHPETWNTTFALGMPRDTRAVADRHAPRIRALWGKSAPEPLPPSRRGGRQPAPFRIACRFEALRRVLNDPAPHARRLARIQRRVYVRAPELLHRYIHATTRRYSYDPRDPRLPIDIFRFVLAPVARPNTS
ncbi:MAG: hypothetical protein JNL81_09830 [Hyphomonadaceae bacterium]|nr:hypothetical protein [Hyphomonadaceae bacterium]